MSFLPRPFTLINRPLKKKYQKKFYQIQKIYQKRGYLIYDKSGMITTTN